MKKILSLHGFRIAAGLLHGGAMAALATGMLLPGTALADIYKWADARGVIVLSNVPPDDPRQVTNLEVMAKETQRTYRTPAVAPRHEATPGEQMILDRLESLERQVREQQQMATPAPAPPSALPAYSGAYYATPALPPPSYATYPPYYDGYSPYYGYAVPNLSVYPGFGSVVLPHRGRVGHHRGFHRPVPHAGFTRGVRTGFIIGPTHFRR
jgi:hypothetical protein